MLTFPRWELVTFRGGHPSEMHELIRDRRSLQLAFEHLRDGRLQRDDVHYDPTARKLAIGFSHPQPDDEANVQYICWPLAWIISPFVEWELTLEDVDNFEVTVSENANSSGVFSIGGSVVRQSGTSISVTIETYDGLRIRANLDRINGSIRRTNVKLVGQIHKRLTVRFY